MCDLDIWNYFRKCDSDEGEKKARCLLCDNVFNYTSTIHNLKTHIKHRHSDKITFKTAPKPKKNVAVSRKSNSGVWLYFTKLENKHKVALCNLCDKSCSYKTTITNLKTHLARVHIDEYNKLLKSMKDKSDEDDDDIEGVYLEYANIDDDSNQSTSAPDVWSFFEQETGGRARCVVCRATLPHRARDLKLHLKDNHPKLAQDFEDGSDHEDDENETYTEVVYLEDDSRKSYKRDASAKRRHSFKSAPILKKVKKRKSSSSSEELLREKTFDDNDDQIETFGTYVTCLLKKIPKDVCTKLQMDIINLIMTTKLKLPSEMPSENKMIIDGVPVAIQTLSAVPGTDYIVTVPSTSDCVKQNVTVSGECKADPLTQDNRDMPKIAVTNSASLHNC